MKSGFLALLGFWIICSNTDGRRPLLAEFSFKKINTGKTFTGVELLKRVKDFEKTTVGIQQMLLPRVLQHNTGQVHATEKTTNSDMPPKQSQKRNLPQPKIWFAIPKGGGMNKDEQTIKLGTSHKNQNFTTENEVRDNKLENETPLSEQISPRQHRISTDKRKELTAAKEIGKLGRNARLLTFSKEEEPLQTNLTVTTQAIYPDVTVTVKSVGTPQQTEAFPFCSWIDQTKCPDVSKLPPSCIESPTIPAVNGKCKMCPFNWCFEPNDMTGNVGLHDESPADVMLNAENWKMPKFALATSQQNKQTPIIAYINTVHKSTTDIPFWDFETFGP